jgi:hypothetical protein
VCSSTSRARLRSARKSGSVIFVKSSLLVISFPGGLRLPDVPLPFPLNGVEARKRQRKRVITLRQSVKAMGRRVKLSL